MNVHPLVDRTSHDASSPPSQSFRDKYEPLTNLRRAEQLWQAQYDEAGQETKDGGGARRYLLHHLLTGSVLAVWGRIEAVYDMYNTAMAQAGAGTKRFAMRIARIVLSDAPLSAAAIAASALEGALSPHQVSSPKAATMKSPKSTPSKIRSPAVSSPSPSLASSSATAIVAPQRSLVGIWVPATRIKEVLRALRKHEEGVRLEIQQKAALAAAAVTNGSAGASVGVGAGAEGNTSVHVPALTMPRF